MIDWIDILKRYLAGESLILVEEEGRPSRIEGGHQWQHLAEEFSDVALRAAGLEPFGQPLGEPERIRKLRLSMLGAQRAIQLGIVRISYAYTMQTGDLDITTTHIEGTPRTNEMKKLVREGLADGSFILVSRGPGLNLLEVRVP